MYYDLIKKFGNVIEINDYVNKNLEVTKYLIKHPRNTVYFKNLDGYEAVGNIWAERKNISVALNNSEILPSILYAINNPVDYEILEKNPFYEKSDFSLKELPIPKYFERDGSNYITSAIVFSEKGGKKNVSFHRMMVIDDKRVAIRLVPRDLYRMYEESVNEGNELKVSVVIGAHPTFLIAAATSVDYSLDESMIASSLRMKTMGEREKMVRLSNGINVPLESEYVFEGKIINEKYPVEGPFLDITRTYDIKENQPILIFEKMYTNKRPIFHLLLAGGYEHYNLMGMPREPTIYQEVKNKGVDVLDVKLTYGGCSWLHGVVKIRKKCDDDGKNAIEGAFKGHRSLKHVVIVDDDIDINNSEEIEWAIATRFQGDRDMVIRREKGSSLDPSRYENDITTKIGFDATIKGKERENFRREF